MIRFRFGLASAVLATLATVSVASHANQLDKVSLNCSNALSINGTSALELRCTGDFSLSSEPGEQGFIEAEQSLSIWAAGTLSLQDVRLSAPNLSLASDTALNIGTGARLDTTGQLLALVQQPPAIVVDWGPFRIGQDEQVTQPSQASAVTLTRVVGGDPSYITGQIQLNGDAGLFVRNQGSELTVTAVAVPEPGTGLLSMAALLAFGLCKRMMRRQG